jgi:hypothetical protein
MAIYLANGGASMNLGLKDLQVQEKETEPTPGVGEDWSVRGPVDGRS